VFAFRAVADANLHIVGREATTPVRRCLPSSSPARVLASDATVAVLGDEQLPGSELRDLVEHTLKHLERSATV
jgi:hypothetical protein